MIIGYYPFESEENEYCARFKEILASFGSVVSLKLRPASITKLVKSVNAYDVVIVNWIDNKIVSPRGTISILGIFRFLLDILFLKIVSRKTIFVRHNVYPHKCKAEHSHLASRIVDLFEYFFDKNITHSGHNTTKKRYYVPHPLYSNMNFSTGRQEEVAEKYVVVFGRIMRYKGIEKLISSYDGSTQLVIAGPCADSEYLEYLQEIAKGRAVVICNGFLSASAARSLVKNAAAVIIPHSGPDMIVSGTFFFALSCSTPVLAMRSPFLEWLLNSSSQAGAYVYNDVRELVAAVNLPILTDRKAVMHDAAINFGDSVIRERLSALLDVASN